MSDTRPVPTRRTAPTPAPDEGVDPAELRPPSAPEGDDTYAALKRRAPAANKPLTTRLDPEVRDLIDRVARESGATIQSIVENAIKRTYGGK